MLVLLFFIDPFIRILSLPKCLHVFGHIRDKRVRVGLARSLDEARRLIFSVKDIRYRTYTVVSILCKVIIWFSKRAHAFEFAFVFSIGL